MPLELVGYFCRAALVRAKLQKANLLQANLKGAIYTNTNSTKVTCESIDLIFPCPTLFPEGFNPQKAGMVLYERNSNN